MEPFYSNGALAIYHKPNAVAEFWLKFQVGEIKKDFFLTEEQFNEMVKAKYAYEKMPKVVVCGDGMKGPVIIGAKEPPDITDAGASRLLAAIAAEDVRDFFKGECDKEVAENSFQLLLEIIADAIPREKI